MDRDGFRPARTVGRWLRRAVGLILGALMVLQPLVALAAPLHGETAPRSAVVTEEDCCPVAGPGAAATDGPARLAPSCPHDDDSSPCCPEGCRRCPRSCCGGVLARPDRPGGLGPPADPSRRSWIRIPDAATAPRGGVFHPPRA